MGKQNLKFTWAATQLNKGELHCKDSARNITCQAGQVSLILLALLPYFAEFPCNLQQGKWLCCTLGIVNLGHSFSRYPDLLDLFSSTADLVGLELARESNLPL